MKSHHVSKIRICFSLLIIGVIVSAVVGLALDTKKVFAQSSCTNLNTGFGVANYTFTSVTAGTHSVWLRVKGSDNSPALKYSLSGGGGTLCDQSLTTTGASSWKWVKSTSAFTTTGGSAAMQISSTEAGVGLDCIVLTSVSSFAPTNASGCAGPQVDTTAPSAAFTAPGNNSTHSSTINITATASDAESGIQNVAFSISGRADLTVIDTTAPYERSFDTTVLGNGSITLTIVATNGAGMTTTVNRSIMINNTVTPPLDTTKPITSVTAPENNATIVGGSIVVSADASDNVGVSKLDLHVDGTFKLSDTTAPYTFSVSGLSDGSHQLYVVASDASNNLQQSATVSVTTKQFKEGDINGDGSITLTDFFVLRTNFGRTGMPRSQGDLNGDGSVTLADFFILRQNFGK